MDDFLFFLVSGICYGSIIALIALGYTLVYGIIKLINFAHGEFFMVGAYAGYGLFEMLKKISVVPEEPSLFQAVLIICLLVFVSGIAGAAIAVLTEWIAYKPIRKSGRLAALLTAIGVSFFLQSLFNFVNNAQPLQYASDAGTIGGYCQQSISIGGTGIYAIRFVFIPITVILTAGLWFIVMKTNFGKAMRAVSQDPDAAALMGINADSVIRKTFILGGFLAGVAGTLIAFQGTINPTMGFQPGLKAFVAAVLGGIGSIPGAVLGGYCIGIMDNLIVWLGVPTSYKDISTFLLLILCLVIRPQGILGKPEREKV